MNSEYGSKGLVVIGVSDESEGLVKPYAKKNKMEYLVAFKAPAAEYKAPGIPRAWLIDANGVVVHEGHPSSINAGMIEQHLKNVRLRPTFKFGSELKKANKLINAGSYGKGITELQKIIDKGADESVVAEATAAITEINEFGEGELKAVDSYADSGFYVEAMNKLRDLAKTFKGTSVGERADEKYDTWRKDKTIKLELDGAGVIAAAKQQISKARYKDAARTLASVAKNKKFEGTKVQAKAAEMFDEVMKKL